MAAENVGMFFFFFERGDESIISYHLLFDFVEYEAAYLIVADVRPVSISAPWPHCAHPDC